MDEGRRPDLAPLRGSVEALDVLPTASWTVLHDVPWPGCAGATIDHVVVGPTGVYVIDAHGESGCDAGRPAQAASALAPVVADITCQRPVPVLCLERRKGVAGWAGNVLVCSTANVDRMLRARAAVLTPAQVEEAVQVLAGAGRADAVAAFPAQAVVPQPARTMARAQRGGARPRWWRASLAATAVMVLAGGAGRGPV